MLQKVLLFITKVFVKSSLESVAVARHGTEFAEARGNYATIAHRGKLPCMWWADTPYRTIIGADIENTPASFCDPCRVVGGPIVRPPPQISSRGVCHFFTDENNYSQYQDGFPEPCWGPKPNPKAWGEVTWELPLPQPVASIESAYLEIADDHSAQARLHAYRPGETATILVNDHQASHFMLNRASSFHEFLPEAGQQPFESSRGQPIDVSEFIDKATTLLRVSVRVGPYSKWDVFAVRLHLKIKHTELSPFSYTLIGAFLGVIFRSILR